MGFTPVFCLLCVCVCLFSVLKPVFGPYTICGCWPFLPLSPPPPVLLPARLQHIKACWFCLRTCTHTCTCVCAQALLTLLSASSSLPQPLHFLSRQSKPLPHLFFSLFPLSLCFELLLLKKIPSFFHTSQIWAVCNTLFLSLSLHSSLFSHTILLSLTLSLSLPLSLFLSLSVFKPLCRSICLRVYLFLMKVFVLVREVR